MVNNNNFSDFTKMFGDFNQVVTQFRRQAEVVTQVAQILTENGQAASRRLAEIARSNGEHVLKASKDALNHNTPETAASKQAEFVRGWLEYNANGMRELAEQNAEAMQKAFDIFSKQVSTQVKEFSEATGAHHAKKKAAA